MPTLYFWCDKGRHRIRTKVKHDETKETAIYCPQHKQEMRLLGTGYDGRREWQKLQKK